MKLIRHPDRDHFREGCVLTLGNFDGVHRGHQALLHRLTEQSALMQLPSVVMMFEPQPAEYFYSDRSPSRLTAFREKFKLLEAIGIDYCLCLAFNKRLAQYRARDFVQTILNDALKVRWMLVGKDMRFGYQREGNVALLKQELRARGACLEIFEDWMHLGLRVSSTQIRHDLSHYLFENAEQALGRPFTLSGRVICGAGLGRQWGTPTANIMIRSKCLPFQGVYTVYLIRADGRRHPGVANLGKRPTVDGTKSILEVHGLEMNESLYGERVSVQFLNHLRPEIKFGSVDALIKQIEIDKQQAIAYFAAKTIHVM